MKHEKAFSWWYPIFTIGFFSFLILSCGTEFQPDNPADNSGDPNGPVTDGSDSDYGLFVSGQLENDLHTISVRGSVSPVHAGKVKVSIKQTSTNIVKTATPYSTGVFYASFALDGPSNLESFKVTVVDDSGSPRTAALLLEVDLMGEWKGDFTITSKSDACDRVPVVSSLNTPITVKQEGNKFVVYLGGYLDLYPIPVYVGEDLSVSGSGTIGIPSSLAVYVGCYEKAEYSFEGQLDTETLPASFAVNFSATLSGVADDCSDPPDAECLLTGLVTGERE